MCAGGVGCVHAHSESLIVAPGRWLWHLELEGRGRGFGWKKYPNATLYARGMIYIGSGVIRYE